VDLVEMMEMENGKVKREWNRKRKQKESSPLVTAHGLHTVGRLLHAGHRGD